MKGKSTKKGKAAALEDELRPEYDEAVLKNGVRGKYAQRYRRGTNLVRIAPDLTAAFPDDEAVDQALRLVLRVAADTARFTKRADPQ